MRCTEYSQIWENYATIQCLVETNFIDGETMVDPLIRFCRKGRLNRKKKIHVRIVLFEIFFTLKKETARSNARQEILRWSSFK